MELIEIEIETELLQALRELLIPYGITAEELAAMFITWCAEHPQEATAYLRSCMTEQS